MVTAFVCILHKYCTSLFKDYSLKLLKDGAVRVFSYIPVSMLCEVMSVVFDSSVFSLHACYSDLVWGLCWML